MEQAQLADPPQQPPQMKQFNMDILRALWGPTFIRRVISHAQPYLSDGEQPSMEFLLAVGQALQMRDAEEDRIQRRRGIA